MMNRSDQAQLRPQDWFYTITITNRTDLTPTPVVFEEVVLFYKRLNLSGIVTWRNERIAPGQSTVFTLCVCDQLESYAWGAWAYLDVNGQLTLERVASVPADPANDPPMTPQLRNQIEAGMPGGVQLCEDSYVVGP